jgi:hypothetical protein
MIQSKNQPFNWQRNNIWIRIGKILIINWSKNLIWCPFKKKSDHHKSFLREVIAIKGHDEDISWQSNGQGKTRFYDPVFGSVLRRMGWYFLIIANNCTLLSTMDCTPIPIEHALSIDHALLSVQYNDPNCDLSYFQCSYSLSSCDSRTQCSGAWNLWWDVD